MIQKPWKMVCAVCGKALKQGDFDAIVHVGSKSKLVLPLCPGKCTKKVHGIT